MRAGCRSTTVLQPPHYVRWTIGSVVSKSKIPENQNSQIVKLSTNALVIRMIEQLDSLFSS